MPFRIEVKAPARCVGCYSCVFACSRHLFNSINPVKTAVFVKANGSLRNPFTVVVCRFCAEPECAIACPREALIKLPEGGVTLIANKCEGCETFDCITACQVGALILDPDTKLPVICDKCGDCAKFCPHNVFTYEEIK
jgi:Fe-S-cluster-containing dehydrogenase component